MIDLVTPFGGISSQLIGWGSVVCPGVYSEPKVLSTTELLALVALSPPPRVSTQLTILLPQFSPVKRKYSCLPFLLLSIFFFLSICLSSHFFWWTGYNPPMTRCLTNSLWFFVCNSFLSFLLDFETGSVGNDLRSRAEFNFTRISTLWTSPKSVIELNYKDW